MFKTNCWPVSVRSARRYLSLVVAAQLSVAGSIAAQSLDCNGHFSQLMVPTGFCVRIFADTVGPVRQVLVHPTGQIVAALNESPGLVRLLDTNGDGHADEAIRFGPGLPGTGIAWRAGWLYFAADAAVIRYRWPANATAPDSVGEWIAQNLPVGTYGSAHTMKGIAVGTDGMVYVSYGSATDNCQSQDRVKSSPGQWPCAELETRAGIWRFAPPAKPGGEWTAKRFATGLRNAEAIAIDPANRRLWTAVQGRDFLNREWGWPDTLSANQPAEMLEQLVEDGDYGWPYCQGNWTRTLTALVKAPEYGKQPDVNCAQKNQPIGGFPGHWAPMAIAVVNSAADPVPHPGLFIAFHGSRSRAPLPEDGHFLIFQSLDETGHPTGPSRLMLHTVGPVGSLRPAGVAVSIGGNIYVTDDEHGRIYLIEPHAPRGR
jgi:glucose/arabinose dehydrogenase